MIAVDDARRHGRLGSRPQVSRSRVRRSSTAPTTSGQRGSPTPTATASSWSSGRPGTREGMTEADLDDDLGHTMSHEEPGVDE